MVPAVALVGAQDVAGETFAVDPHQSRLPRGIPGDHCDVFVAVVGAASMAGLPPLLGFVAKEKALDAYIEYGEFTGATAVLVVIVIGSVLTFAYSARYVLGVFGRFGDPAHDDVSSAAHAPPLVFSGPAIVLTVATVVLGLAPTALISGLSEAATLALDPEATPSTVKLL